MSLEGNRSNGPRKRRFVAAAVAIVLMVICVGTLWMILVPGTAVPVVDQLSGSQASEANQQANIEALIVLEGARSVRKDAGAFGSRGVAYLLTASYPASDTIEQISSHLKSLGWEPLEEDWLNPGMSSSLVSGWSEYVDGTRNPPQRVHHWMTQWQDEFGNLVNYSFRYSYLDKGKPDLDNVWVSAAWYPAEAVRTMKRMTARGPLDKLSDWFYQLW